MNQFFSFDKKKTAILAFVLSFGILFNTSCSVYTVVGESMSPNVREALTVVLWRFSKPTRGDVIRFYCPRMDTVGVRKPCWLLKRVVGLPGEEIRIDGTSVFINGKKLDEPYIKTECFLGYYSTKLKDNEFWVMGDNRPVALDSRHIGPVQRDQIDCAFRLWFQL